MINKTLCVSCVWYQKTVFANGKERHYCGDFGKYIPGLATECNSYMVRGSTSKQEMKNIAWILERKKKPGFETPEIEFRKPNPDKNGQNNAPNE